MLDSIAYYVVKGLNKLFGLVPVAATLWLGRRLGTVAFWVNRRRRLIAYANLKSAFAGEKSPAELRTITKRVYQTMVQTFMEVLNLTKVNKPYVDRYVEVVRLDRMRDAVAAGRGTILLTAHFGDWELSSLVSSVKGWPIMVLVREQKMKRLNELLNSLRESNGCQVIRKGMEVKNILRELKKNHIVGILADQDAGRNGMFVDFFGRPTSCHAGPLEIASRTGALIVPNFNVRQHGPYHKLYLEEYIDCKTITSSDPVREGTQRYMHLLERYVRQYPEQWLWLHKRWKSTPVRTVLVLDDGKAGHRNQSLAVAEAIRLARTTQRYALDDTRIVTVPVRYRSPAARSLLTACAAFATWRCHGCMRCMRACLAPETYEKLMATYADFVVSCGSSLAPVNIFMAKENNAKNIVIMQPGIPFGLRQFSLAVIPEHDSPPRKKNIVTTMLAPNLIDEEKLKNDGEKVRAAAHLASDKIVGLFIGGDNPEFTLSADAMAAVLDATLALCAEEKAKLLVTTSRRTSREVEELLRKRLAGNPACALLVIANEKNPPETVAGIMALSRVVIVSEESISMISEALSAGKSVVVYKLAKKVAKITKHERMLAHLEREGFVRVCDPQRLGESLTAAWTDAPPEKQSADRATIFAAVRRLI